MDRYSLGISFGRQKARAIIFNIDRSVVEGQVVVPYLTSDDEVVSLLTVIDLLFLELSKFPVLKQVAMIKVSGPEDLGICTTDKLYKCLMTFSAYAESLKSHFSNCFASNSFLKPEWSNKNYADEWAKIFNPEFRLPENAMLFSIKSLAASKPEVWKNSTNIQFLSSFVTSILAGKRAPIDASCSKISGMQGSEFKWSDSNTQWVSNDLKGKLDEIKNSYENFSYISSYFVEKYGIYREARILTASGNSAACARGAGGSVYLDTEDSLHLSAVVSSLPSGNGSFYLNGIMPGQYLCMVASAYDLWLSQQGSFQKDSDSIEDLYGAVPLKPQTAGGFHAKINWSSLILSQLLELKSNSIQFEKIFVAGDFADNTFFLQACADLFSSEICVYENSVFGTAIGNALSAARKIKESDYESVLKGYFDSVSVKTFTPSSEGLSQMLSQLIAYSNR